MGTSIVLGSDGTHFISKFRALANGNEFVQHANGATYSRRVRKDARIGLTCVVSHPARVADLGSSSQEIIANLREWLKDAIHFLFQEFQTPARLLVLHLDEEYPHCHFFAAGHARDLHPGVRAEYQDGRRLADGKERVKRHRLALRDFLDRYFNAVGSKHGHQRAGHMRRLQRIKSRAAYLALSSCARALSQHMDRGAREQLEQGLLSYDHARIGPRRHESAPADEGSTAIPRPRP